MATLAELKTELAAVETALSNATVESYSITGSHSVKYGKVQDLEKRAATLRKRIYRFQGYTGRTTPDFSTGNSKNVKDYL
jgi:hypothetical protein